MSKSKGEFEPGKYVGPTIPDSARNPYNDVHVPGYPLVVGGGYSGATGVSPCPMYIGEGSPPAQYVGPTIPDNANKNVHDPGYPFIIGDGYPPGHSHVTGGIPPAKYVGPTIPDNVGHPYSKLENDLGIAGVPAPGYIGDDPAAQVKFDFSDKSIRKGFIRKVYAILMCQMLVTVGLILLFTLFEPSRLWARENPKSLLYAFGVMFATMIPMACCDSVRRQFPANFIFLGIFTLAMSFQLGVLCSVCANNAVLMALGLTATVCFALTMFAFQTKWDFTACAGIMFACLTVLLVAGISALFISHNEIWHLFYSSIGAVIFSILLVIDTQLIMGGDHSYSISPEEYVFAALTIYLDIINIFIHILRLFSGR